MTIQLQLMLVIFSALFFLVIMKYIKKARLSTDIAIVWILWALGLIIMSLVPGAVNFITRMLGIYAPINAIFLIMIFLLYCLVFYLCIRMSMLEDKVKNLVQHVAMQDALSEKESGEEINH